MTHTVGRPPKVANWRRRVAGGYLFVSTACSGVPIPGEGPESYFTRCMALLGYEVSDVTTGGDVEDCCGFQTDEVPTPAFDAAMIACEQEVYDRFG